MTDTAENIQDAFVVAAPGICKNCKNKIEGSAFYPRMRMRDGRMTLEQDVSVNLCKANVVVAGAAAKKVFVYEGRVLCPMSVKPLCSEVVRPVEDGGTCAHYDERLSSKMRRAFQYIPIKLDL